MRRLCLLLVGLSISGCGTSESTGERASRSHVTEQDRIGSWNALELLIERFPSVRVTTRGGVSSVQIRQYTHPPLLVVDGQRMLASAAEALSRIPADDVVDIDVKHALSDTMVYGADAALGGVIEVTTRLGRAN